MAIELSEQEQLRRQSLAALRELGINPYPAAMYDVNATAREITEHYDEAKGNFRQVRIAGRIMTRRIMGSASFFARSSRTRPAKASSRSNHPFLIRMRRRARLISSLSRSRM